MLKINNLFVSVNGKDIVRGVSLVICPGEIHALMGPNGSGKSSLAMALAGHPRYGVAQKGQGTRPACRRGRDKGQGKPIIELDKKDITDKTPDERARLGLFLAMQYPVGVEGITPEQLLRRTVQENQSYKGPALSKQGRALSEIRKIDVLQFRKDLEKLAKKVGVKTELLHRSINVGFSGGEKKRLEILQMLTLEPRYAILDETDSGLDVDALRTIAVAVRNYVNARSTKHEARSDKLRATRYEPPAVLVITHYARLLKYLKPNFVHIMKNGEIVESGGKEVAERIEREGYKGGISN